MEWQTGYVPAAILLSLGDLHEGSDRIPRDREVALICETGVRSATGASILLEQGFERVSHIPLGTSDVRRRGGPLEYPGQAHSEAS